MRRLQHNFRSNQVIFGQVCLNAQSGIFQQPLGKQTDTQWSDLLTSSSPFLHGRWVIRPRQLTLTSFIFAFTRALSDIGSGFIRHLRQLSSQVKSVRQLGELDLNFRIDDTQPRRSPTPLVQTLQRRHCLPDADAAAQRSATSIPEPLTFNP